MLMLEQSAPGELRPRIYGGRALLGTRGREAAAGPGGGGSQAMIGHGSAGAYPRPHWEGALECQRPHGLPTLAKGSGLANSCFSPPLAEAPSRGERGYFPCISRRGGSQGLRTVLRRCVALLPPSTQGSQGGAPQPATGSSGQRPHPHPT